MTRAFLTRRQTLTGAAGLGLAIELTGARAFADGRRADRKLVVIICRGGLDGR